MAVPAYFEGVYGYPYEPGLHGTMLLGMHIKRMRERLGDAAELERRDGRLTLRARRSFVLRDPRAQESLGQRAPAGARPRGAARRPGARARARRRTLQRELKELVLGEGLVRARQGRAVVYQLEDTTFSEPTRSRRFEASPLVPPRPAPGK